MYPAAWPTVFISWHTQPGVRRREPSGWAYSLFLPPVPPPAVQRSSRSALKATASCSALKGGAHSSSSPSTRRTSSAPSSSFSHFRSLSFLTPRPPRSGRSNPSPLSFFFLFVRLVLESLPAAAAHSAFPPYSEGGSGPWDCSARFLSKKKKEKEELLCSLSVCVVDVSLCASAGSDLAWVRLQFRFMERWSLGAKVVALALLLSAASHGRELPVKNSDRSFIYNHTLAKTLVEYASAVYMTDLTALFTWTCSRCNDLTQGFEMRSLIVDVENCLQAFVGVDHSLNSIIVAIRGTQENSVQNWIKDLIWKQLDLSYPNMSNAKVHSGFFSSYNSTILRLAITNAVHKARKSYGDINVIVTGHSMGGAMASFCALDLALKLGGGSVQLMTFGQPRVGNAAFASYFAKYVPNTIRVTHGHDIVPHLPPYFSFLPQLTYHHFPREVWVQDSDGNTTERICDDSGEDPDCCRCISMFSLRIQDHFTYLGVDMEADDWSTCRIITAQSIRQFRRELAGNIIMTKHDIDVSIVEPSVQNRLEQF